MRLSVAPSAAINHLQLKVGDVFDALSGIWSAIAADVRGKSAAAHHANHGVGVSFSALPDGSPVNMIDIP